MRIFKRFERLIRIIMGAKGNVGEKLIKAGLIGLGVYISFKFLESIFTNTSIYKCHNCKSVVAKYQNKCHNCGFVLKWQ